MAKGMQTFQDTNTELFFFLKKRYDYKNSVFLEGFFFPVV